MTIRMDHATDYHAAVVCGAHTRRFQDARNRVAAEQACALPSELKQPAQTPPAVQSNSIPGRDTEELKLLGVENSPPSELSPEGHQN